MKILVKQNRNFIWILRFVVGITGTVQGVLIKEFALSLAGFLLVYMAIADVMDSKDHEIELKELEHEKVDARL